MKRFFVVFAFLLLFFGVGGTVLALVIDGNAGNVEWSEVPLQVLVHRGEISGCGILYATARVQSEIPERRVLFSFSTIDPELTTESLIGVTFLVDERCIASWTPERSECEEQEYYIEAAHSIIIDDYTESYSQCEVLLQCKSAAAFSALDKLSLQLLDAKGIPSRELYLDLETALPPEPMTATIPVTTTTKRTIEITTKLSTTKATTASAPSTATTVQSSGGVTSVSSSVITSSATSSVTTGGQGLSSAPAATVLIPVPVPTSTNAAAPILNYIIVPQPVPSSGEPTVVSTTERRVSETEMPLVAPQTIRLPNITSRRSPHNLWSLGIVGGLLVVIPCVVYATRAKQSRTTIQEVFEEEVEQEEAL